MTIVNKKTQRSTKTVKNKLGVVVNSKKDITSLIINDSNDENTGNENIKELLITLTNINASEILLYHNDYINEAEIFSDDIQETVVEFSNCKEDIAIGNLLHEKSKKSKRSIMFLDPHRCKVKFWETMIDLTSNGPLPRYTNNPCWWCRNKFSTHPIGCPIRYNYQKNTGLDKERIEERMEDLNLPLDQGNDFFETEGVFCTFPCVKAYIIDQISRTKSPNYRKALTLLTLLYLKLMGSLDPIPTAGTWKLTSEWGGHMSPLEFRSSNGVLEYIETVNTKRPYMFCSSNLIKEKRLKQ
jgi:hypothetical protein